MLELEDLWPVESIFKRLIEDESVDINSKVPGYERPIYEALKRKAYRSLELLCNQSSIESSLIVRSQVED